MKIKTKEDFWIAAECWYQRTHRLREITESETETPERKSKALKLFMIMMGKMQIVSRMAYEIDQAPPPKGGAEGGPRFGKPEPVINPSLN